ncbi:MAG: two-component regulator propeller domain-containing protein [Anaerolineae bacterium]
MGSHTQKIRRLGTAALAWLALLLFVACGCASPAVQAPPPASPAPTAPPPGAVPVLDQVGSPAAGRRIEFRQLTIEQGLSQSTVNCIVQDSRGFMWFGTQDGLDRYDGYEFRVYKNDPDDEHSLSANWIRSCYRDQRDSLWFVTDDTVLHRYDPALDRFDRYPLEMPDPNRQGAANVRVLLGDRAGRLWIGTYGGGLVQYDPESDQLVYYPDDLDDPAQDSPHDNKVYAILEDSAGVLWFGTGEGLVRYDETAGVFVRYPYQMASSTSPASGAAGVSDALRSPYVTHLVEDAQGRLWVGTTFGGLHQFDRETGQVTAYPFSADEPNTFSGNSVRSMLTDREGKLWVASAEVQSDGTFARLGLERLDPDTGKIIRFAAGLDDPCELSHDSVLLMHEDRQGTLWFHTFAGGVDLYDRQTGCFSHYAHEPGNPNTLSDDSLNVIYEDESGGVWLGTGAGGLSFYHPTWSRFPSYAVAPAPAERVSNNMVLRFYVPPEGIDAAGRAQRLWISTGAGINLWDRSAGTFKFYQIDPALPDTITYALYEGGDGSLWLGTNMGLYQGVVGAGGKLDFDLVLPRTSAQVGLIAAILPDAAGHDLWLGRYRVGLTRFDPATGEVVHTYERNPDDPDDPASLVDDVIQGVFPGLDGTLWIATNSGLDHFDPATETFVHYRHDPEDPDSLAEAGVHWVYQDQAGIAWAGTNGGGLQRLDPASGAWTHYSEEDGLPNDVVYAILPERGDDGAEALWLSTNNGLSRFDPRAGTFRNYTSRDGLQSNEFNSHAAYLAPHGEMIIGAVDGLNLSRPDLGRPVCPTRLYHRPLSGQPAGCRGRRCRAAALGRGGRHGPSLLPGPGCLV